MNEARFTRMNSALAMTCAVEINIRANAAIVWRLLTDAQGFPRWNSTVTGIEGEIREGERLKLHVPGTNRTFTPTVSGIVPARRMMWSDGVPSIFRGVRTFVLTPHGDTSTDFVMEERFSGLMFALVKRMLPDFQPIFETYANDLKREAERISHPVQATNSDETRMLYMVIETFRDGDPVPVYRRFRDRGRLMPEGIEYRGSWVTEDLRRCFQIMECQDRRLLDQWMTNWNDITDFEVIPVVTSVEAAAAVAPQL